jgi:hypothetical protein
MINFIDIRSSLGFTVYNNLGDIIGLWGLAYKFFDGYDNGFLHILRREVQIGTNDLQHSLFAEKLTKWILRLGDPIRIEHQGTIRFDLDMCRPDIYLQVVT